MATVFQDIASEVSDNWPAFLYIAVMTGFSVRFLCERRAETRTLKKLGDELHATVHARFDRLEYLVRHSNRAESVVEGRDADQFVAVKRRA
jgi:hypothetical protein